MKKYFIIINGQQSGPFSLEELFDRHITSETLVWAEGMQNWTPAWEIEELKDILRGIDPRSSAYNGTTTPNEQGVTPPPYQLTKQLTQNDQQILQPGQGFPNNNPIDNDIKTKDKSKIALYSVIAAFIILLIFAFTAPSKKSHEEAIREEVEEAIQKKADCELGDGIFASGLKMFTSMLTRNIVDQVFNEVLDYHNYIIFSTTSVKYGDAEHTVSWGILGKVFTMNSDDILKAIDSNSPTVDTSNEKNQQQMEESIDNTNDEDNSDDVTNDNSEENKFQKTIDKKVDEAVDRVTKHVEKKVEQKVSEKLNEVADSSTIDKIIDKIMSLF